MKRIVLIAASLFIICAAQAAKGLRFYDRNSVNLYSHNSEPIAFLERGIVFYVFINGDFDFNTEATATDFVYRQGRAANRSFDNGGVRIQYDNSGRVRRVGNVFINYDFQNRIKRIGSINMFYNRLSLAQVGGLRLIYNRFGDIVDAVGSVNGRPGSYYGPSSNFNFGNNSFSNNPGNGNNFYNYENAHSNLQTQNNSNDGYLYKIKRDSTVGNLKENPVLRRNYGRR